MIGYTTTSVANVESWNGSAWTETTDVNTARENMVECCWNYSSDVIAVGVNSIVLVTLKNGMVQHGQKQVI